MNTKILLQRFLEGRYDELLKDIYLDETLIDYQRNRYINAINKYVELFGDEDVMIFSVPGRSEVGGNHTDHQHGKVLACSINLDMIAVASKNRFINLYSDDRKVQGIDLNNLKANEKEKGTTKALVKGVLSKLENEGYRIGGFNGFITSDVLVGSGLSSSAAFEVMIATIISGLYNRGQIDPVEIAKYSQYAENVYFGKPSGLMDQMACSVGSLVNIDFIDINKPKVTKVEVDFSKFGYSLCIVDTKGSHASLTDEYAAIPNEMKKVANYFGKNFVVELMKDEIINNIDDIRQSCGDRAVLRSLHVLNENERVDKEVEAIKQGDFTRFLQLVKQSGDSSYKYLQNVYPNSDFTNQSVSIALMLSEDILNDNGVARVHGGGFAGTIQAFVKDEFVETYRQKMDNVFGQGSCHVLKVRKYGGMIVIN